MKRCILTLAAAAALVGCVGTPAAPPASRPEQASAPPAIATAPAEGEPIALRLSAGSVGAGRCLVADVRDPRSRSGVVLVRVDSRAPITLDLRGGRGRARVWLPWSGRAQVNVRAVEGSATSPVRSVAVRPVPWMRAIDDLVGGRAVSVSVARGNRILYSHLGAVPRPPASDEKLLLSMALLDRFGPRLRIPTTADVRSVRHGVVPGDVWLIGHGDPEVGFGTVAALARRIAAAGIRTVRGSVVGDTSAFGRERWAPGWHRIALSFVPIPTALTFEGNEGPGGFVFDPELRAAAALTVDLRALGVRVAGAPHAAAAPRDVRAVAKMRSAPLVQILRRQNVSSINLDAEVLGKLLGAAFEGGRGTIAKGAAAIGRWARRHGVRLVAEDASGLSYRDAVTSDGLVRLLAIADRSSWGDPLRSSLPAPGEGTLAGRLGGLRVRAKTGTLLDGVSALSGWVWAPGEGGRLGFSILSEGMPKAEAVALEDAIVRVLAAKLRPARSRCSPARTSRDPVRSGRRCSCGLRPRP